MHETLNISLSQRSNHLITHFYNTQLAYLDGLSSLKDSPVDPSCGFKTVKKYNTVDLVPRCLMWDMKGGSGALSKFEYAGGDNNDNDDGQNYVHVEQERVEKNAYQKSLDLNQPLPKLNKSMTKYWSDYSNVIYDVKSFNFLKDWEFDPDTYKKGRLVSGQTKEFVGYELGVEEWKEDYQGVEFMEENYRTMLEECDLINGINIISEVDSAWGGFSGELLDDLRDNYNPKNDIVVWGLNGVEPFKQLKNPLKLSKIQTVMKFLDQASLIVSLSLPTFPVSWGIESDVFWQTEAIESILFESFNVLNSQKMNSVRMNTLINDITLGENRKLVSGVNTKLYGEELSFVNTIETKSNYEFSNLKITRPPILGAEENSGTSSSRTQKLYSTKDLPFPNMHTFPEGIVNTADNVSVAFTTESCTRSTFLEMKEFASRYVRNADREDLISQLSVHAEHYESGFYTDDEDSE